jgi:hypothetical protein
VNRSLLKRNISRSNERIRAAWRNRNNGPKQKVRFDASG